MNENSYNGINPLLKEDLVELFNSQSLLYRRVIGKSAIRNVKLWHETLKEVEDQEEGLLLLIAYQKRMVKEISEFRYGKAEPSPEEEPPLIQAYNPKPDSKVENRTRFVAENIAEMKRTAADLTWIRGLLEGYEHKKFHRSMLHRVLKRLPAFLPVKLEIFSGKTRALLPKNFFEGPDTLKVRAGGS